MDNLSLVVLDQNSYTFLCFIAGLGWGLWLSTFLAALTIDSIKYRRWVAGQ